MKKVFALSICLCISLLIAACNSQDEKVATKENCAPLNPNGDTELAVLMREMAVLSEANAAALRSGGDLVPYDGHFNKLTTAKGSMSVDEKFFKGMAGIYLGHLEALYKAAPEQRVELHNNLVKSCQDCHSQTCRGPLKRIDKMVVTL